MKLSEAIRLGSMMHPQGFGRLKSIITTYDPSKNEYVDHITTCALGAAREAGSKYVEYERQTPDVYLKIRSCPVPVSEECPAQHGSAPVMALIVHLNDSHKWTREKIADWLEQIEMENELNKQREGSPESHAETLLV